MRRLVTGVVLALAGLYLLALFVPVEPYDRRPGLALVAPAGSWGDPVMAAVGEQREVQVETRTWLGLPHSVTTLLWRDGEALYVPCARCPTKRWPRNVAADPQVRIKIGGRLYDVRLQKIGDDTERRQVLRVFGGADAPADVWAYRLLPR